MRTYLVVVDESPEAETALRFAARRAAKTGGAVRILALIPPAAFVQWGGVQATMEDEALQRAEAAVAAGRDVDIAATELAAAHDALGQVSGAVDNEALLGAIFSRFCIGK